MFADPQLTPDALHEAEAIVDAEWMRLSYGGGDWDRELAELLAELRAPGHRAPRGRTGAATDRRPTATSRTRDATWPTRRSPVTTVWPTQRSPPRATPATIVQRCSSKGGDAPIDNDDGKD